MYLIERTTAKSGEPLRFQSKAKGPMRNLKRKNPYFFAVTSSLRPNCLAATRIPLSLSFHFQFVPLSRRGKAIT